MEKGAPPLQVLLDSRLFTEPPRNLCQPAAPLAAAREGLWRPRVLGRLSCLKLVVHSYQIQHKCCQMPFKDPKVDKLGMDIKINPTSFKDLES